MKKTIIIGMIVLLASMVYAYTYGQTFTQAQIDTVDFSAYDLNIQHIGYSVRNGNIYKDVKFDTIRKTAEDNYVYMQKDYPVGKVSVADYKICLQVSTEANCQAWAKLTLAVQQNKLETGHRKLLARYQTQVDEQIVIQ